MSQPQREDAYEMGSLNRLFAASSVAFAVCVIWMWADDYLRPWKTIQRAAADVEEKTARRADKFQSEIVAELYDEEMIQAIKERLDQTVREQDAQKTRIRELKKAYAEADLRYNKADLVYQPADQAVQQARSELEHALVEARVKLRAEARARKEPAPPEDELSVEKLRAKFPHVDKKYKQVEQLEKRAAELRKALDKERVARDEADRQLKELEADFRRLDGVRKAFERERDQARMRAEKARYGLAQRLSDAPGLDMFHPTLKPDQLIVDFPDARNFDIYVRRYDRCVTCHVNIQKREYSLEYYDEQIGWAKRELEKLTRADADKQRVEDPFALKLTEEQAASLEKVDKGAVRRLESGGVVLVNRERAISAITKAVEYYSQERRHKVAELLDNPALKAHPNLNLLMRDDGPHPMGRMGCTICHLGDGHRTDFRRAAHTPDADAWVVKKSGQKVLVRGGEQLVRDRETGDLRPVDAEKDGELILQSEHWRRKYGWKPNDLYYWEDPMLPPAYVESSCLQCHFHVTDMPKEAAPKLNLAHRLIRDNACYGCHAIRGNDPMMPENVARQVRPDFDEEAAWKRGPSLENIHLKWTFAEAARWIMNPKAVRPTTRMPSFFQEVTENGHALLLNHRTDSEMPALDDATVLAMTAFLFDGQFAAWERGRPAMRDGAIVYDAKPAGLPGWIDPPAVPQQPDARTGFGFSRPGEPGENFHQAGKRLFVESGCLACHTYDGLPRSPGPLADYHAAVGDTARTGGAKPSGPFGPDLTGLHFKLHARNPNSLKWLFNWLRAPEHYWATARMPNLRLNDSEALAIAAFLLEPAKSDHGPAGAPARLNVKVPSVDPFASVGFSDDRLNRFNPLTSSEADAPGTLTASLKSLFAVLNKARFTPEQAEQEWARLSWRDKWTEVGRGMIKHYGCAGCHNIRGMERETGIAPELSFEGSKPVKKLDFGGLEKEMAAAFQYTRYDWIYGKLLEPRIYDQGKYKTPLDRLKMPKFGFTPEEARALTTYIIGLRVQPIPEVFMARYSGAGRARRRADIEGAKLLEKYNCVGCHMLEPAQTTFEPRPSMRGRREINLDWLYLPRRVTAQGLVPAGLESLPTGDRATAVLKALREDDDLKELTDVLYFQFWQPPWQDGEIQKKLRARISPAEREQLTKRHVIAVEPDLAARVEEFRKVNSFLRLDSTSALTGIPRGDVVRHEPPRGGRLYEAIFAYYATAEARDKAAELARSAFGSAGAEQIEEMLPYALQMPKLRRWDFAEGYLKDYLSYLLYKAPPPLIGEGSKVQASWLYRFLHNPHRIRPLVLLNMPRYKFREGEVGRLADWFAARDNEEFPYQKLPETHEEHTTAGVRDLFARGLLRDDTYFWGIPTGTAVQGGRTFGQFAAGAADAAARDQARARAWLHVGERTLFSVNAGNRCMNCHSWGDAPIVGTQASQPGEQKVQAGPNLIHVHERLRPEYLWKWLPQPALVLPGTPMPPNWGELPHTTMATEKLRMLIPAAGHELSPRDRNRMQIAATIDLLMNPRRTLMSRPGARHETVWPEIVKSMGLPPDDPVSGVAGAAPGQ